MNLLWKRKGEQLLWSLQHSGLVFLFLFFTNLLNVIRWTRDIVTRLLRSNQPSFPCWLSTQHEIPLMFRCHTGFFYITNVLTCMSNSKCFLQPFTVDRGWLTVFDLNLHSCRHCMTYTTKELSSRGKESRMKLALGQEYCIEWLLERNLKFLTLQILVSVDLISPQLE